MAVVFTVTGTSLDPDLVSSVLDATPDRVWRRGEQKEAAGRRFESLNEESGWKKFAPAELREELAADFEYWLSFIKEKKSALAALARDGHAVALDVLVQSDCYQLAPSELALLSEAGVTFTFRSWEGDK